MRQSASSRARLSIGEVLSQLRGDFPGLNISKIRFLEAEGLIEPEQTPSGYRKFSHQDVERLRYVLTCQREHYLPLKVIREHLDAIDRGLEPPALSGTGGPQVPRVVLDGDGYPTPESFGSLGEGAELRLSRNELLTAAQIEDPLLEQLETYGLVRPRQGAAPYDGDALVIAKTAGELAVFGLEPRHLRAFKTAADREIGLVEQVVSPIRRGRDAGASARAEEAIGQMAALSVRLHATLVKAALRACTLPPREYAERVREVDVIGVRVEMPSNQPIVLLREVSGDRYLPIWIGAVEATAIAFAQQGVVPPRPLTHDLIKDLLNATGHDLSEVRITEMKDGIFYAVLVFDSGIEVSARPSDSIALALRTGSKIVCAEDVLDEAGLEVPDEQKDEVEKFREFLDQVSPEDFESL